MRRDRPRDDVARRELVDEALAAVVEQRRTGAAERLGEQEAVVAVVVAQRRRVELDELEIGKRRARGLREQETFADRAARVRRPRPERGVAAGGENDRRAAKRAERRDPLALGRAGSADARGRAR